ncbi:hypothetical protein CgunFtcFv8_003161 [Champsocephalus gunnari]|uniref:Uncharacterized protein n=1 Tax=Champsocephalus gunnari TaxID=52237 RepID=A0AAN8DDN4_CHAGU|nr:hypothetical protein CgunFtcFv8_003161 [Champsocephalus gunnari]
MWQKESRQHHVHGLVRKEIHKMRRTGLSLSLTHVECVPAQLQHQPMLLLLGKNLKPLFYLKDGGGGGEKKSDLLTVDKDN